MKDKLKKLFKFIKRIIFVIILVFLALSSIITYKGYQMYESAIEIVSIREKVKEIKADENYVTIDKVPKDYINAVVAIEDHRFYEHYAVDIVSLGRAIVTDINTKSISEGGSTITQQLAKNMYFSQEKAFTRKVAEVFVSLELEKIYSKNDIIEMYINIAYYGDGFYGIREASVGYFNKEPEELTLEECTLLAGLPNAPSVYALSNNSPLTVKRQLQVIEAMKKYEYISDKEAEELKKEIEDK